MTKIENFHRLQRTEKGGVIIKGEISIAEIISIIREGKFKNLDKSQLPGFLCNRFQKDSTSWHSNRIVQLESLTGYWPFDLDSKDNPSMNALAIRDSIATAPHIIASWVSASGNGVKAIGWWPPPPHSLELIKNFKIGDKGEKYRIEQDYYSRLCDSLRAYLPEAIAFDMSQGRMHQPIFLSHDSDAIWKR
jgi:hypothetical protein